MEDKKIIREITAEDLERYRKHGYLTVKRLKKILEDLPDDGMVLVQRVEDKYYERNNWGVVKKSGWYYNSYKKMNEEIGAGEFNDQEKYSEISPENLKEFTEEELETFKEQYHPAWCYVTYPDDNNLYLDLHY